MSPRSLAALVCFASSCALAQLVERDPDWKETEAPPPTAWKSERLIALEMPRYFETRFGIDPDSVKVTPDGIVRYVVVASAPGGTSNGTYEGIRCETGEFKVYARTGSSGAWAPQANPEWRPLNANVRSHHALAFARQGACNGRAIAADTPDGIIRRLRGQTRDPVQR